VPSVRVTSVFDIILTVVDLAGFAAVAAVGLISCDGVGCADRVADPADDFAVDMSRILFSEGLC